MLFERSAKAGGQKAEEQSELPISTQSVCPECGKVLDAELYDHQGRIWMHKACEEHGSFNELISSDSEFFLLRRRRHFELCSPMHNPQTCSQGNCPSDCGICNQHKSSPCLVNIDLTNRCNLKCPICFANANASGRLFEMSLDQLADTLDRVMGIKPYPPLSVQYAGGEPTVHPQFLEAVKMAKDKGVLDLQAASNGLLFAKKPDFAKRAADAGLDVVYLQFDGMTDDIYRQSRGRELFDLKMQAIENMKQAGIMVTLVPTIVRGLNEHQLGDILKFAIENTDVVTALSFQPVSITGRIDESKRLEMRYTMADMARDLQEQSGILDMYQDWYPFSVISPVSRLLESMTETPKIYFSCHPHCGAASYLVVDRYTGEAVPITRFINLEGAMHDMNKEAESLENHSAWRKKLTRFQLWRKLKKHYIPENAPEGIDFDALVDFVNTFLEAEPNHNGRQKGHIYHKIGERYHVLLLAAMHFQDSYNFELQRVQHCVIHYGSPDGHLYPFCTWNSGPCHRYAVEEQFSTPLT
jgi:hypothetical protein